MSPRSEQPPEFFVDRSLGKSIVEGLRVAGLTVHSMADGDCGRDTVVAVGELFWR